MRILVRRTLRPGLCKGYPIVGLSRGGKVQSYTVVHLLVARAFMGPVPSPGMHVDHVVSKQNHA